MYKSQNIQVTITVLPFQTHIHTVLSNNVQHISQVYSTKVIHCQTLYNVFFTLNISLLSAPTSHPQGTAMRQTSGLCSLSLRGSGSFWPLSSLPRAREASRLTAGPYTETHSDHLSGPWILLLTRHLLSGFFFFHECWFKKMEAVYSQVCFIPTASTKQ